MSILRTKLPKYLKQLVAVYDRQGEIYKRDVIVKGRWYLRENTHHNNWNGGMVGHTVVLFAPLDTLVTVTFSEQTTFAKAILEDCDELATADDEFFAQFVIEAEDEGDPEYQGATPFAARPVVDPDQVSIWKAGLARVFMSHRDRVKVEVREIADALESYGVSCFVAHETIPDDEDWQKVILDGLETMELMVAVTTDDFSQSAYCMQEVGYALGRNIPVISLKVEKYDPSGFIAHKQATKSSFDTPIDAAKKLALLISKRLQQTDRFQEVLINSFCDSTDFVEAKNRFLRMKSNVDSLSNEQTKQIAAAYASNDQLYRAIYLNNQYHRLVKYMDEATEGSWEIEGRNLINKAQSPLSDLDEDIPF